MLLAAGRYVTCLFCGVRTYVVVVAAVRAVVGHVAPRAQAVAIVVVLAVIVVVPVVVDGPPWFWRDAHGEIKDANNTIWDLWCVCRVKRADCQWCRSHRM